MAAKVPGGILAATGNHRHTSLAQPQVLVLDNSPLLLHSGVVSTNTGCTMEASWTLDRQLWLALGTISKHREDELLWVCYAAAMQNSPAQEEIYSSLGTISPACTP